MAGDLHECLITLATLCRCPWLIHPGDGACEVVNAAPDGPDDVALCSSCSFALEARRRRLLALEPAA